MEQKKRRILVLVNNCFSKSTSNGRTLGNMFLGYPKELLAQFTTQKDDPDFSVCGKFFYVSDSDALQAFVKGKKVGRFLSGETDGGKQPAQPGVTEKKTPRNALTMLLRDMVWNSGRWKRGGFTKFVEDFRPELIVLQAGDCAFMLRLARRLSKKYGIPYVIFNTEGFYFNKNDYFKAKGLAHWVYPLFRRRFVRQFRKAMKTAAHTVYHCDLLQEDYSKCFDHNSTVIYAATELQPVEQDGKAGFRAVYLGNLGLMRQEPLMEIGKKLHDISPDYYLDVYGKVPNEEVMRSLEDCPGIRYRGFVNYEEATRILCESDLVVHAENFAPFYRRYLRHGFSTKIPDALASGRAFLLYAPEEIACCQYLKRHEAAFVATNQEELETILRELTSSKAVRGRYRENALTLVERNHRPEVCAKKFQEILQNVE